MKTAASVEVRVLKNPTQNQSLIPNSQTKLKIPISLMDTRHAMKTAASVEVRVLKNPTQNQSLIPNSQTRLKIPISLMDTRTPWKRLPVLKSGF